MTVVVVIPIDCRGAQKRGPAYIFRLLSCVLRGIYLGYFDECWAGSYSPLLHLKFLATQKLFLFILPPPLPKDLSVPWVRVCVGLSLPTPSTPTARPTDLPPGLLDSPGISQVMVPRARPSTPVSVD